MLLIDDKTKEMCDKVIKNDEMLGFISSCSKDQKMCNKAVDNYSHALGFFPNWYKTQKNV